MHGLLDPESAALVTSAVDLVTAPRRGGPRFVRDDDVTRARNIADDPRSTGRLALDALVEMVRIAGAADTGRVFGTHRPAVTVHVTLADLDRRRGAASIDGQSASVSIRTAERIVCSTGYLPVRFGSRARLDLGRTERFFTGPIGHPPGPKRTTSRRGNTAAPPTSPTASCSAATTTCSSTNNGWSITRTGRHYTLHPPPGDPSARITPLAPKNPTYLRATSGSSASARSRASGRT
ncbi:MAG TPA: DUF222 domain-containing protein [Pseudolysinimonas sp.]|nr:DUF222 domain-containing protein [Pseudolysinimonas sp.]